MSTILPPFTCSYSPNIPELIHQMGISLVLTTYQAGKTIIISAPTPEKLVQLPRNFDKAMGIALKDDMLAIASKTEISVYRNSPNHAKEYPDQPDTYDNLFIPRATYYTGHLDAHDLVFTNKGLLAVNTSFSCLSYINHDYSFNEVWKPHFISEIEPGDRCHLNGVALKDGDPKYVSALGTTNTPKGWKEKKSSGGIIMDVYNNEIIIEGLCMPHSPRIFGDKLYILNSGKGELLSMDMESKKITVVKSFPYFLRGMAIHGDYLFIGLSKIRKSSTSFQELPISETATKSGVIVMYLPYQSIVGTITYENSVEEIYDLQVMPFKRPGLLGNQKETFKRCISTKESSYWLIGSEIHE